MVDPANTGPQKSETSNKLIDFPLRVSSDAKRTTMGSRLARYWIPAALVLVVVLIAAATWWGTASRPNLRYVTAAATRGAITRNVTATGTVNPQLTIIVGSYVSGVIQDLYCDYNTQVKKGQLCAKIDPRPYQTAVDQSKANLAVAQAQLEKDKAALAYAKVAFERNAKLLPTLAVSRDAYDNTKSNYEQAQAQIAFDEATIQQRQAALDAAQVNLDYTDIISPVDGTVVSRNVTIGQTVAASFQTPTLFLIATDLTKMQVDTNVSESDVGGIVEGQRSKFTVDAYSKRTFEGVVTQIRQSPQTVQNVVTYDIVVTVDNQDLALKPGLTAATRIITNSRDGVLRVPNAALRYRPSGTVGTSEAERSRVWVLRDGSPTAVTVTTGLDDDNFTEIAGGDLRENDQVIVSEQNAAKPLAAPRF